MSRLLLLTLLIAGTASAAPPVAAYIFPAGGQRGTTVPVRVGGLFVHESCGFALDGTGVTASPELKPGKRVWFEGPIIPLPDSQQAEDYPVDMQGTVTVDANAAPGSRRGRIGTSQGVATGPVFVVGDLPEVVETEIDGDPLPEAVTLPVTANGRVFPREDIDLWAVKLTKDQTLSALATTTGIRSPLVAKLEVVDVKGAVLAQSGSRAAVGFDVSVRFTAPADGTYHVRIADARGQGGPAFVYRLTMTTSPVADSVFPLGGNRGTTVNLNGDTAVAIPADAPALWQTRLGSQPITLDTDDLPEFVEAPGNPVAPPAMFNGRIEPAAAGVWKVELKKAKKYELELRAKKLGSPLCGTLVLLDAEGKEVAKHIPDDPGSDPLVSFQPAADGVYTIRVAERFRNRGGADFAYRLRVRETVPAPPDFRLKLATDVVNIPRAGSMKWKLTAERTGGFNGPIDVSVSGLPAGVTCAKVTIAAGQSQVDLTLSAEALAKVSVGTVSVSGTAKVGDTPATRTATPPDGEAAYVAVAVPTPFVIDGVYTMSNGPRGQPYSRKYSLKRNGFDGPVEILLADRQARHLQGVTGPTVTVPPGQTEFEYAVQLPAWIEIGRTSRTCLMAVGTVTDPDGTKHRVSYTTTETNYQLIVVPEPGRLGIDLTKEAAVATPGDTLRIPFVISRAKGLTGAVKVECVLPDHWRGVTADAVTVPADKTEGELVLKMGKDASGPFNMPATVRATAGVVVAEAKLELLKKE
jgi:hypothetical protein